MSNEEDKIIRKAPLTAVLAGFLLLICAVVAFFVNAASGGQRTTSSQTSQVTPQSVEATDSKESVVSSCVIRDLDTEDKTIVLYDITNNKTIALSYTGATDIKDRYDQILSATQLSAGELVEVSYDEANQTLTKLARSNDAWEYTGVSTLKINRDDKIMTMYGDKYRYTQNLFVQDADGEIALLSVNANDVLTVRGYDKTIYSITVTKGHGSLRLTNMEYFEGGNLTIGTEEFYGITEDMVYTVREGNVNVTIEKDGVTGTKNINILRNQEITVDMSTFAPDPVQTGEVTFVISPFGADLIIDGELASYANPIELTYGEHSIEVSLDGYQTYEGTYELTKSSDIVQIELPETTEEETEEETTTDSSDSDSTTSDSTTSSGSTSATATVTPTPTVTTSPTGTTAAEEDTTEVDSDHILYIKSPSGASVYINGVFKGIAPVKIDKPIGMTYITLLKEGYEQITHTVSIDDDDEDKTLSFPALKLSEEDED